MTKRQKKKIKKVTQQIVILTALIAALGTLLTGFSDIIYAIIDLLSRFP